MSRGRKRRRSIKRSRRSFQKEGQLFPLPTKERRKARGENGRKKKERKKNPIKIFHRIPSRKSRTSQGLFAEGANP